MPHNVDAMAYYGEPPWHGLGVPIPNRATAEEMIYAARLNWEVEKLAIPNVGASAHKKPRRYHLIRMPLTNSEPEVPLGVVSSRYRPLQNFEAFRFFVPIIGAGNAAFETAGSLGNGERVWVLAKAPGELRVLRDDCCSKYLLLSNSHDGRSAVIVKFTPIRVVCQNTLMLALESGQKSYRVRHSTNMLYRMQDVQDLLSVMWQTFEAAEELFQTLARVQVDTDRLNAYLNAVYPTPSSEHNGSKRPERLEGIEELFENGDAPQLAPSHTLWGAYNAVTRYEDYRHANEAGPDRRLNRVWFGQGADLKLRALNTADTLCRQWVN